MMLTFLLAWGLSCDGPTSLMGNYRVILDKASFCVGSADRSAVAMHHQAGTLIAVNEDGVVFKKADAWFFLRLDGKQVSALKSPGVPALQNDLSGLTGPAFFNQNHLWRWEGETWVSYPLDVFFESKPPQPVPASQYGLNLLFPQMGDQGGNRFFMYQEKSGQLYLFKSGDAKPKAIDFGRERRAFKLGKRYAWSGAPDEEDISLANPNRIEALQGKVRLANLNKHSLIVPVMTGCWVLTFPSGLRDGLKSWDSGTLPIKGHYLWLDADTQLQVTAHELPKLPLNFELTTSASGSPRLNVEPRFQVFGVFGSETLVVIGDGRLYGLMPDKGLKTRNWNKAQPMPISLVRVGKDLGGYDPAGQWQLFFKGWF